MPHHPHAQFDETVLEMIEHSPIGAVPLTPSYQDALGRLYASHQIYADADHKGGHVTARSLARLACFHASNLELLAEGASSAPELESNAGIFARYVHSLPAELQPKAETRRAEVAGRPVHHRKHGEMIVHDPVHTLFLVPGAGPHVGLPGNYLYGSLLELIGADGTATGWSIHIHDSDDGAACCDGPSLAGALEKLQEVIASAPFHLTELAAIGFKMI